MIIVKKLARKLLNEYFERPMLFDYLIMSIVLLSFFLLNRTELIKLSSFNSLINSSKDIATVGLTVAGFVLTILTVLIGIKISFNSTNTSAPDVSKFYLFLNSELYKKSTSLLKWGVINLIFVSVLLFSSHLIVSSNEILIALLNVGVLVIIIITFFRCFLVLDLIMDIEEAKDSDENLFD